MFKIKTKKYNFNYFHLAILVHFINNYKEIANNTLNNIKIKNKVNIMKCWSKILKDISISLFMFTI